FVTAAQSVYAVSVLANRRISVGEATTMLGLFMVQLVTKLPLFEPIHATARITVGCIYLVLAAGILFRNRAAIRPLMRDGLRAPYSELVSDGIGGGGESARRPRTGPLSRAVTRPRN